jgi:hypothetical protein
MKKIVTAGVLTLLFCVAAFADIAPIKPAKTKKSVDANLTIRLDKDAKQARLIIPKSAVRELRAQLDDLDQDGNVTAAASVGGVSRIQTIMAGVFLSLAIVFGGVWFTRSKRVGTKTAALIVLAVLSGAVVTIVYANAGPPPEARSITGKLFAPSVHIYNFASGPIKIETTDEQHGIELIVPDTPETPKPGEE